MSNDELKNLLNTLCEYKDNKIIMQEKGKLETSLEELHAKYLSKVEECRTLREELKAFTTKEVVVQPLSSSKA